MKLPGPIWAMTVSPTATETWPAAIIIKAGTGAPSIVSCSPAGALCQDALLSSMPICEFVQPFEHGAQQVAITRGQADAQALARQAREMQQIDGDEHQIPGNAGIERAAADQHEIGDLEAQADDRSDPQPIDVGQPVPRSR